MHATPIFHTEIPSPLGPLTLRGTTLGLTGLFMAEHRHGPSPDDRHGWVRDDGAFATVIEQLDAYFAGRCMTFDDLPVDEAGVGGTAFQRRVWGALREIPYGRTISYAELARRVGAPRAARAVGLANGRNPLSIVVPCHRVVGADGRLVGYGGGTGRKRWLLAHETRPACFPA